MTIKIGRGEFYTTDAAKQFLPDSSVDLFLVNPPFFGIHEEAYGNYGDQMHVGVTQEQFVGRLVDSTCAMERALSDDGVLLMLLPNKPFIFSYIAEVSQRSNLVFGQLHQWDLMRDASPIGNYSAVLIALHKGEPTAVSNAPFRMPTYIDTDLYKLAHIGHIGDSLPVKFYRHFLDMYSKPGDVVADIMAGTGSFCIAADQLDRGFIYNDISESQTEIAVSRYKSYLDLHTS